MMFSDMMRSFNWSMFLHIEGNKVNLIGFIHLFVKDELVCCWMISKMDSQ